MDFGRFLALLEAHDKLATWAQFAAALITLGATYFTATAPLKAQQKAVETRQRALRDHGTRLLKDALVSVIGFCETIEEDRNVMREIEAFTFSLRQSSGELRRFPVSELDEQDERSLAAGLSVVGGMIEATLQAAQTMAKRVQDLPEEGRLIEYHERIRVGLARRRRQAQGMAHDAGLTLG